MPVLYVSRAVLVRLKYCEPGDLNAKIHRKKFTPKTADLTQTFANPIHSILYEDSVIDS